MDTMDTMHTMDTSPAPDDSTPGLARPRSGYSIVEVVIAGALLLFIALSILPLFTQAMRSNLEGQDSTAVANHARSRAETLMELPFNSTPLTIAAGTELVTEEVYSRKYDRWLTGTEADLEADDAPMWFRTTTVRQYSTPEDQDGDGIITPDEFSAPLPAGTDTSQIHLKEIFVEIASPRLGGPFGAGKSIAVQLYKAS